MVYFYSALIAVWAGLFTLLFLSGIPPTEQQPMIRCVVPPTTTLHLLSESEQTPKEEFVPIKKDDPIPTIAVTNKELSVAEASPKTIEDNIRTLIENRLVSILVRVNIAACKQCTKDDKRVILQLKMAKALTEGKVELAQYYSKEMEKYLKKGSENGNKK